MKRVKLGLILGMVMVLAAGFASPGCAPGEVTPTIEKIPGSPVVDQADPEAKRVA